MTNTLQRQIIAGPSREELFDALRLRHEGRNVTVTLEDRVRTAGNPQKSLSMKRPITLRLYVDSIGVEDGIQCGNNWMLTLSNKDGCFKGYFNTTSREGWLMIEN